MDQAVEYAQNVEKFEKILINTKREGVNDLIEFIRKSDFYSAPASSRFHNCHPHGLLEHSLNVYTVLMAKKSNPIWKDILNKVDDDSLAIASLLHDLCKTYTYTTEIKNKKVYSERGKKSDSHGRYDWVSVEGYTTEDQFPYGHGEKSVMMIEQYMHLKPNERYMIRWHMGYTEPKEYWHYFTDSIKKYPEILALHESDIEATYLLEEEE